MHIPALNELTQAMPLAFASKRVEQVAFVVEDLLDGRSRVEDILSR